MSSFIVKGGDGYKMIPENLIEHRNTGFLDNDLLGKKLLRRNNKEIHIIMNSHSLPPEF